MLEQIIIRGPLVLIVLFLLALLISIIIQDIKQKRPFIQIVTYPEKVVSETDTQVDSENQSTTSKATISSKKKKK